MVTQLDFPQVLKGSYDEAAQALKVELTSSSGSPVGVTAGGALEVEAVGGSLVPASYDEIDLTYVPSGNGVGQIQTVIYKLATITIATLTLTYNSDNNLTKIAKT